MILINRDKSIYKTNSEKKKKLKVNLYDKPRPGIYKLQQIKIHIKKNTNYK